MSEELDKTENSSSKTEIIGKEKKMQSVLQELQIMATQRSSRNNLDISKFDKEQVDKLLETVSDNEKNAFQFHTKKIDAIKEIELAKINASTISQKTLKFVAIGAIVFILPTLTILIMFFKDAFFIPWLTFLTGILGGFGVSKATSGIFEKNQKNPLIEDSGEEE